MLILEITAAILGGIVLGAALFVLVDLAEEAFRKKRGKKW